MGDGIGGYDKLIGETATNDECANLVGIKEPNANGATRRQDNGSCYAEFGEIYSDGVFTWKTCLFRGQLV